MNGAFILYGIIGILVLFALVALYVRATKRKTKEFRDTSDIRAETTPAHSADILLIGDTQNPLLRLSFKESEDILKKCIPLDVSDKDKTRLIDSAKEILSMAGLGFLATKKLYTFGWSPKIAEMLANGTAYQVAGRAFAKSATTGQIVGQASLGTVSPIVFITAMAVYLTFKTYFKRFEDRLGEIKRGIDEILALEDEKERGELRGNIKYLYEFIDSVSKSSTSDIITQEQVKRVLAENETIYRESLKFIETFRPRIGRYIGEAKDIKPPSWVPVFGRTLNKANEEMKGQLSKVENTIYKLRGSYLCRFLSVFLTTLSTGGDLSARDRINNLRDNFDEHYQNLREDICSLKKQLPDIITSVYRDDDADIRRKHHKALNQFLEWIDNTREEIKYRTERLLKLADTLSKGHQIVIRKKGENDVEVLLLGEAELTR
jgi:hypothetical protein